MKQIVFALCIFCLSSPEAQVQGVTCLNCKDISLPKYCQETTECGQEETCEVVHQGISLVGKRDDPAPRGTCYECCSTTLCNNALCHGPAGQTTQVPATNQGVTCMSCDDSIYPEHCRHSTVCGSDEICFTREYTDHKGLQAYRLGCESKARCSQILNATSVIGRRELSDSQQLCYDCCASDECNAGLCSVGGGNHTGRGCPWNFVPYKDKCYVFVAGAKIHSVAWDFCRNLGAQFVSIHSKEDNEFIAAQLYLLNDTDVKDFWTAGFRPHQTHIWEYLDKTPFDYTNWGGGFPYIIWNGGADYYLTVGNPAKGYLDAPMFVNENTPTAVMCAKPRV